MVVFYDLDGIQLTQGHSITDFREVLRQIPLLTKDEAKRLVEAEFRFLQRFPHCRWKLPASALQSIALTDCQ